jgi:hypothetical protein
MAARKVSVEDWVEIANLIGEYQWRVDDADQDGWAGLFTEDGAFVSVDGEGYRGREALKQAAAMTGEYFKGLMRHSPGAIWVEYGQTTDEAVGHYYSLVTTWFKDPGPEFFNMVLCDVHLRRVNGDWKIQENRIKGLYRAL